MTVYLFPSAEQVWSQFFCRDEKTIETGDWFTDQHKSLAQEILMDCKVHYWCRLTDSFLLKAELFKYMFLTHIG